MQDEVPIVGSRRLPPDPRIMDAIGANHRFETAVADLVDNAIDARATSVLVRFVTTAGQCSRFVVADNGQGIAADAIDRAMTVGGNRAYSDSDLGHFGWGLKAASLSQADSLTLLSRAEGSTAVGRRWVAHLEQADFECDEVDPQFAARVLLAELPQIGTPRTVVRWDRVRCFPASREAEVSGRFLQDAVSRLAGHLGLVFHRFLQEDRVRLWIDVADEDLGEGPPIPVVPVDPLGYVRTGRSGYPRPLRAPLGGGTLTLMCHIWPGGSKTPAFRLDGRSPEQTQGFYFYRRDRLLQAGGWNAVEVPHKDLRLARVAVDLDDASISSRMFRMNPEKSRIEARPAFTHSVEEATGEDGMGWGAYLQDARTAYKQSQQRTRTRPKVIGPGRGFTPDLRKAVARELEVIPHEDPVDIRWERLPADVFFSVDRDQRTIWLNKTYRWAVVGETGTSLNDAPLVKALLYLLIENLFQGSYLGPRDKDNIELWQGILITAARAQAR